METVVNALRDIVGEFEFYARLNGTTSNYTWDYGAMLEYACGVILVCVCVSAVFKFLTKLFN